jgi:hypothetical protein
MADEEKDYKVGTGRPPLHTRFQKGQSGNPGGRSNKNLHALLADELPPPSPSPASGGGKGGGVFVTVDGEPRRSPSARRSSISSVTPFHLRHVVRSIRRQRENPRD